MAEGERRRLRPFPGVQLAFGRDGVSTTVSEHIAVAKGLYGGGAPPPVVRSAGIGELRRILEAAALRHADLSREIAEEEDVLAQVRRRLRWAQMFVARLTTPLYVRYLVEQGEASIQALADVRAERDAGKVEIRFAIDTATAAAYVALTRAFEDLAGNERIWDIAKESPDGQVQWARVAFSAGRSDIVACDEDVLVAPRAGGGSLQILPGFVLLREGAEALVLEHGDVELDVTPARFLVADEDLPRDARVVGQAAPPESEETDGKAAKALRPVVEYGRMTVLSADRSFYDQSEPPPVYVFSNFAKARVFVEAYDDYKQALAAIVEPEPPRQPGERPRPAVAAQEPPLDIRPRRRLWLDWAALVLIVIGLGLPFVLPRPAPPVPAAPPARPIAAVQLVQPKPANPGAHAAIHKSKRPNARAAKPSREVGKLCGLVRQPTGEVTLVPCPASQGASSEPQ